MLERTPSPTAGPQRRAVAVLLAVVAQLALTAWLMVPGHLSIDEGTYHAMVASLVRNGELVLDNGYEELRSRELEFASVTVHDGHLAPLPPPIYPAVAAPFYLAAGWRGLFWLQSLSFLGVVALIGWIAQRWFPGQAVAVPSMAVFSLAGFAWIYSQAAWPHMLATLAVVGAWALTVRSAEAPGGGRVTAAAAGLVLGLGIGVRLDAVFAAPALASLILASTPRQPGLWLSRLVALGVGTLPPLAALTVANRIKFGRTTPFSYGDTGSSDTAGIAGYLPFLLAVLVLAALAAGWVSWMRRVGPGRGRARLVLPTVGLALLLVALAVPALRQALLRFFEGAYQIVVDLRVRDPTLEEPALARSAGGALIYLGGIKKALLQSCPYLVACALPLLAAGRHRRRAWLLAVPPLLYVGVYSYFAWHGGMSLNLRYLIPALPFLSILSVLAWRMLRAGAGHEAVSGWTLLLGGAALSGVLFFGLTRLLPSAEGHETVLLTVPLALAAGLGLALAGAWRWGNGSPAWRRAAAVALAAGWVWAGLVAFGYDYRWERRARAFNQSVWAEIDPLIAARAMLAVSYPDPFFGSIESPGVTLAVVTRDELRDFRRLATYHFERGVPVYAALEQPLWNATRSLGQLEGLVLTPLWTNGRFYLAEIEPATEGGLPSAGPLP